MVKKIGVALALLIFSSGGYFYSTNQNLNSNSPRTHPYQYSTEEQHFVNQHLTRGQYQGFKNTKNYYERFHQSSGTIENPLILVTGLEDITENWWLLVQIAFKKGFKTVYVYELRGQGRSERTNDIKAIDIQHFSEYSGDMVRFLRHLRIQQHGTAVARPLMITHSTGSLVAAAAMRQITKETPTYKPEKVVHISPLFKLNVSPILKMKPVFFLLKMTETISRAMGWIVIGKKFVIQKFEENKVTNNRKIYEWSAKIRQTHDLMSSGVSLGWATATQEEIWLQSKVDFKFLDQPNLILLANDEQVVDNDWKINNPHFQIETIENSKHAMHMETPKVLQNVLNKAFDFLLMD